MTLLTITLSHPYLEFLVPYSRPGAHPANGFWYGRNSKKRNKQLCWHTKPIRTNLWLLDILGLVCFLPAPQLPCKSPREHFSIGRPFSMLKWYLALNR